MAMETPPSLRGVTSIVAIACAVPHLCEVMAGGELARGDGGDPVPGDSGDDPVVPHETAKRAATRSNARPQVHPFDSRTIMFRFSITCPSNIDICSGPDAAIAMGVPRFCDWYRPISF
jgi:hypothetical protein